MFLLTIKHSAEDDLDAKMRDVSNEPGFNSRERVKKYDALLQRYLNLVKQGQKEETLHKDPRSDPWNDPGNIDPGNNAAGFSERESEDVTMIEVMKNLPQRSRKNAEYIMKKISENDKGWPYK